MDVEKQDLESIIYLDVKLAWVAKKGYKLWYLCEFMHPEIIGI